MTGRFKSSIVLALLFTSAAVFSSSLWAQSGEKLLPAPSSSSHTDSGARTDSLAEQLRALTRQVALQQQEINELRIELEKQQKVPSRVTEKARLHEPPPSVTSRSPRSGRTEEVRASASSQTPEPTEPRANEPEVATAAGKPMAGSPAKQAQSPSSLESSQNRNPALTNSPVTPIPLHIGSATLTPVGFVDATEFFRTTNVGSGIGTSFGSIPFSNTLQGRLSENRFTIQNSRLGLEMDTDFSANRVRAYLETDFLGLQPGNAFVTSNSDSLRMRLYWVDLSRGKFEFLAGQSWSLLTPGRTGISPMPADIFYTEDMDTNYQVGLAWARQLQFRFVYHASPRVAAAISLEDAEQYVGAGVTLPPGFSASQVSTGAATSTPNTFPDVVGKLAFDPEVGGKHLHFELAGVLSRFRTYSSEFGRTAAVEGGGGSFNFNLELFKHFHLVESSFLSRGEGRYVVGLGPDFVVHPDGTPSLVTADSGVAGFEYQATPRVMFYGYYGGVYLGRNFSVIPVTNPESAPIYIGYGYPAASALSPAQNRAIQEPTFGIIRNFWKSPRYGALQLITQYSYLTRAPWYVAPESPKNAHLSQAYADIRYVLP
ncbi:MAG: hypothetical protein ACRD2B_17175 [Terriglobia bacterium]